MSCGRMAAHAAHIAGRLAAHNVEVDKLDLIVLEVPTSTDLESLRKKLEESSVDFLDYKDNLDRHFSHITGSSTTALALFPIEKGSCAALNELKAWCCACNNEKDSATRVRVV